MGSMVNTYNKYCFHVTMAKRFAIILSPKNSQHHICTTKGLNFLVRIEIANALDSLITPMLIAFKVIFVIHSYAWGCVCCTV